MTNILVPKLFGFAKNFRIYFFLFFLFFFFALSTPPSSVGGALHVAYVA